MKQQSEILEVVVEKFVAENEKYADLPKSVIEKIIKIRDDVVIDDLLESGKVRIPSMGTLSITYRAPRQGRNPATGEDMEIAETLGVKFSVAAPLKKSAEELDITPYREQYLAKKK